MAVRKRTRSCSRRIGAMAASRPLNEQKIGEAARMMFGSREEMRETFAEWEAAIVKTICEACERAQATGISASSAGETEWKDKGA